MKSKWFFICDAFFHLLHAFFPNWAAVENMVGTEDFDHKKMMKNPGHFRFNLRCVVWNLIKAFHPWVLQQREAGNELP